MKAFKNKSVKKKKKKEIITEYPYSLRLNEPILEEIGKFSKEAVMRPGPFTRGLIILALEKVRQGILSYDDIRRAGF